VTFNPEIGLDGLIIRENSEKAKHLSKPLSHEDYIEATRKSTDKYGLIKTNFAYSLTAIYLS
jgi:hypothetical protein